MTVGNVHLPEGDDLAEVLLDLAVPHEDIGELLALRGRVTADPGLRRMLDEGARSLVESIGRIDSADDLPRPELPEQGRESADAVGRGHGPVSSDAVARCFPVYVFVAVLPHVRAYHRARSVPEEVSRRTLADLGRQMAVHRRAQGTGGLVAPQWLRLHFTGLLYGLGRLQFERGKLGKPLGSSVAAAGLALGPGDDVLGLHVPDYLGPLTPGACDRSLGRARQFFARCFPEVTYRVAECHSWLLDPQLVEYLPRESNVRRFQERFHIAHTDDEPSDEVPVGFVFGDTDLVPAALPRRTGLERAIGDHLRSGKHWYSGHGWFEL
ncbi:acyltransferase domain-containing protein [Streptomyces sp. NPDC047315]|uniref:acyltransferase domain-containing protein n=1 Tax=Streptomyces sp. NPDC047315 TaxID=3155142 RepID=UPI0034016C94